MTQNELVVHTKYKNLAKVPHPWHPLSYRLISLQLPHTPLLTICHNKKLILFFRIAVLSAFEVNRLLFSNIFPLFDISVTQLYSPPHHATATSCYIYLYIRTKQFCFKAFSSDFIAVSRLNVDFFTLFFPLMRRSEADFPWSRSEIP